jgi:hypothetical protein
MGYAFSRTTKESFAYMLALRRATQEELQHVQSALLLARAWSLCQRGYGAKAHRKTFGCCSNCLWGCATFSSGLRLINVAAGFGPRQFLGRLSVSKIINLQSILTQIFSAPARSSRCFSMTDFACHAQYHLYTWSPAPSVQPVSPGLATAFAAACELRLQM